MLSNTFQVVGALINAVFLIALCFSITVEAIKRFLVIGINVVIVVTIIVNIANITFIIIMMQLRRKEILPFAEPIENPKLILIVGSVGLLINLVQTLFRS